MSDNARQDASVLRLAGEAQIGRLALRAGDVLVVKVDRVIDSVICNRIHGSIKPHLPDGVRVLVIDAAIELSVLTRADINARAG